MRILSAVVAAATGVGLVAVGGGSAGAAPAGPAAGGRAGPGGVVRLVTGDAIQVGADGRVVAQPQQGAGGQFLAVTRGAERFIVPEAALPFLGRQLDPELFEVGRAARGLGTPGGRFAVQVTYRPGAAHHAIPGVTVTGTHGATDDGYLTRESASRFGAALADRAVFDGVAGIRPVGVAAPAPAPSRQQLITLLIKVVGANGKPVPQGSVVGLNAADFDQGNIFGELTNGQLEVTLPAGDYGLIVSSTDPETRVARIVSIADHDLSAANGTHQTLTVDMGQADQLISASTPRPSTFVQLVADVSRFDALGNSVGVVPFRLDGQPQVVLVAPAPAARVGQLTFGATLQYASPPGVDVPYAYTLAVGGTDGVPADVHYEVTDADLATVNDAYFTDGQTGQNGTARMISFLPWQHLSASANLPFTTPGRRVDYVTGREDASYEASYSRGARDDAGHVDPVAEFYEDSARRYEAGQQVQADWGRQPVHPDLAVQTAKVPRFECPACREDDVLRVRLQPTSDAAGHPGGSDFGANPLGPVDISGHVRVTAGDTTVLDQDYTFGDIRVDVPADATRFGLVVDKNRVTPWTSSAVHTHTEWGFTSAHPAVSTIPSNWTCGDPPFEEPAACAVLPMLLVGYTAPVDLTGRAHGGPTHLGLSVAPTQAAPPTTITAVSVDVSFDDGATWTPATVTGSGGHYDAAFTAPASGFVTTRVRATDSAGSTISQTITRGYALGG